jgi:GNAT superfamily N-acetyltransferase
MLCFRVLPVIQNKGGSELMNQDIHIVPSTLADVTPFLEAHFKSLSYPFDSYIEYRLSCCEIFEIYVNNQAIGYIGLIKGSLHFFHILIEYYEFAPRVFDWVVSEFNMKSVYVMTQDSLFLAIISEWEYEKKNESCMFIDSKIQNKEKKEFEGVVIRIAQMEDLRKIIEGTGTFYDSLEQRITEETLFLFEEGDQLLGCGHIEKSVYYKDCVSIGMITCAEHRGKGIGQHIVHYLKEWTYQNGFKPIAGCSYLNKLSRKTLEKAGMIVTSIGYEAILVKKGF